MTRWVCASYCSPFPRLDSPAEGINDVLHLVELVVKGFDAQERADAGEQFDTVEGLG